MAEEWFLHGREDNSFYFRLKSSPDTDMEGFTITYVKPGYGILTGDMGCLAWQRNESGFDYGFPNRETNIGYFEEKVCRAEQQQTRTWHMDIAVADILSYFADEMKEEMDYRSKDRFDKAKLMIDQASWSDCPASVGQFRMYEDIEEYFPDEDLSECTFGEIREYHFKRKFEMIRSVSDLILDAVRKDEAKE
jgi:hypothetical protein